MQRLIPTLAASAALALASFSAAAVDAESALKDRAEAGYEVRKADAESAYKSAKEKCKALSGNARDVCNKEAKANYKTDIADAKATLKSDKAHAEAVEVNLDAGYSVARERCDALSGKSKDACISEAKLKYRQ